MPRIAEWRGKPNATTFAEALQVFRLAKLSKKDVFYDLGCGHGWVCIWASRFCKTAKGIDDIKGYVLRARQNAQKHKLKNVKIVRGDLARCRFPDADVLNCVTHLSLKDFRRWNRRTRKKTLRIVSLGPPPIPIKPVATSGTFCLTRFPFRFARSRDDWYLAVLGKRNGSWTQVRKKFWKLSTEALRSLRHDFKRYYG
jgi:SAM-dependent methyltransferase